jgi:hypothetical protein
MIKFSYVKGLIDIEFGWWYSFYIIVTNLKIISLITGVSVVRWV